LALILMPTPGRCDVVLDWNVIMQATVSSLPPFPQARFAAITQLAVFEAVNAIKGDYKPYLGTIQASPGASAEAAAITAAHAVLKNYFPANAVSLDAAEFNSLASISDSPAKTAGIAVGQAAAAAMIAARLNDGSAPATFYMPSSSNPGEWQPTPICGPLGGAFFQWQNVNPFALKSADQIFLPPPPQLVSDKYARAYNEVNAVGDINSTVRPPDRTTAALFYAGTAAVLIFDTAASQISAATGRSLSENAHDLALINMAISDAAVATFYNKYHYKFWRPETAIHNGALDGNDKTDPNAAFKPLILTPCFPGYPSAHGTLSNAGREMVEEIYGNGPFSITLTSAGAPGVTLKYSRLNEITDDISDARVYGGIHFRTDQDGGEFLGTRIARWIYEHTLQSAHGGGSHQQ
jgi:hypothetical protein